MKHIGTYGGLLALKAPFVIAVLAMVVWHFGLSDRQVFLTITACCGLYALVLYNNIKVISHPATA